MKIYKFIYFLAVLFVILMSLNYAEPAYDFSKHLDSCRWLLVSNRPETIKSSGILFEDTILPFQKTRLFYSHYNKFGSSIILEIKLVNNGSESTEILLSNSQAQSDTEQSIFVGHNAAVRFLENFLSQNKPRLTILPRSQFILLKETVGNFGTICGMATIEILKGRGLQAVVEAKVLNDKSKLQSEPERLYSKEKFNPFLIHPRGVFASPDIYIQADYTAGKGEAQVEIGKFPWLIDKFTGEPNVGNYGAVYFITFYLKNIANITQNVEFYMNSLNGPSMGSFLIDNEINLVPITRLYEESLITSVELAPLEKRTIQIITLPEASSCYPVRIIARTKTIAKEEYNN